MRTDSWETDSNGIIKRDGTVYQHLVNYDSTGDLKNCNNPKYMNANKVMKPFIRVLVREEDINKSGTYSCLWYGSTYFVMSDTVCNGTLDYIDINEIKYWSIWVPWSCKGYNCPNNQASIKEFVSEAGQLPSTTFGGSD